MYDLNNKETKPRVDFMCKGITVWQTEVFAPRHWLRWKDYFTKSPEEICLEKVRNEYIKRMDLVICDDSISDLFSS